MCANRGAVWPGASARSGEPFRKLRTASSSTCDAWYQQCFEPPTYIAETLHRRPRLVFDAHLGGFAHARIVGWCQAQNPAASDCRSHFEQRCSRVASVEGAGAGLGAVGTCGGWCIAGGGGTSGMGAFGGRGSRGGSGEHVAGAGGPFSGCWFVVRSRRAGMMSNSYSLTSRASPLMGRHAERACAMTFRENSPR